MLTHSRNDGRPGKPGRLSCTPHNRTFYRRGSLLEKEDENERTDDWIHTASWRNSPPDRDLGPACLPAGGRGPDRDTKRTSTAVTGWGCSCPSALAPGAGGVVVTEASTP